KGGPPALSGPGVWFTVHSRARVWVGSRVDTVATALLETNLPGLPVRRGKVRDVYDLGGGRLLFVATDRISAFDWVLPNGIPDKGRVLPRLSAFWFETLGVPNHVLSLDPFDTLQDLPLDTLADLQGRTMIVRKAAVVPFECVVRGYLAGSGWKEYRAS